MLLRQEQALLNAPSVDVVSSIHDSLLREQWPATLLWKRQYFFSDDWQYWQRSAGALTVVPRTTVGPHSKRVALRP